MSWIKKIFILLFGLFVFIPQLVRADGMMIPPPHYWMNETRQRAVIFYEDGVETLVVSAGFQGNADDFAWVIPVPNQPEISKGSDELFTSLESLTGQQYYANESPVFGLGMREDDVKEGVTVVETKRIDYYDVTVLSSSSKDALVKWLNKHDYNFPESASYILNSYITNGWYFVAMRVNPDSLDWVDVGQRLRQGHATPVQLTFESKNIVYPLKISSVFSEPNRQDNITYDTGIVGRAVRIAAADHLSFNGTDMFNSEAGTVELWIKPDETWSNDRAGYWELVNLVDNNDQDVFEFRRGKDATHDNLQFIAYSSNGSFQTWKTADDAALTWQADTWYHLTVTWSSEDTPVVYINGQDYVMTAAYGEATWSPKPFTDGALYIGQRGINQSSSVRGLVDEMRILNKYSTAADIQISYERGLSGEASDVDEDTLTLAHFNGSLAESVSGENIDYKQSGYDYSIPDFVTIELYVFADHKKTVPGFSTSWANWVKKNDIKEMALTDEGNFWIEPEGGKFYLTKLTRYLSPSEMTEDIFPRDTDNNTKIGVGPSGWDKLQHYLGPLALYSFIYFIIIVIVSVFSPWGMLFLVGALLQFLSRNRTIHIVFWVLQGMAIAGYILTVVILIFLSVFNGQSMWQAVRDLPMYEFSYGARQTIGMFVMLLPVVVVLVSMAIIMVWQRRWQRRVGERRMTLTAPPRPTDIVVSPPPPRHHSKSSPRTTINKRKKSYANKKKNSQSSRKK